MLRKTVTLLGRAVKGDSILLKLGHRGRGTFKKVNHVLVLTWADAGFSAEKYAEYRPKNIEFFKNEIVYYNSFNSPYILRGHTHKIVRAFGAQSYLYELLETDLEHLILSCSRPFSRQRSREVLQVLRDIVSGLQVLSEAGVVHLDIKPVNILVRRVEGVVQGVIADFGLACRAEPMRVKYHSVVQLVKATHNYEEVLKERKFAAIMQRSGGFSPRPIFI